MICEIGHNQYATISLEDAAKETAGLTVEVFGAKGWGDFSMNGISNRFNTLVIVGEGTRVGSVQHENGEYLERTQDYTRLTNAVIIVERKIGDAVYFHARPVARPDAHYMMGGTFIYSSDSRFRSLCPYPIPVHDRLEY